MKDFNMTNEEVLEFIKDKTVREVLEWIDSFETEDQIQKKQKKQKGNMHNPNFNVVSNNKTKGLHEQPFYQKGRW